MNSIFVISTFDTRKYKNKQWGILYKLLKLFSKPGYGIGSLRHLLFMGIHYYNEVKHRAHGFSMSFEQADRWVKEDAGDISEGKTNEYALIEEIHEGPFVYYCEECQWYRLVEQGGYICYVTCDKPQDIGIECTCNFGLG
jgi:hypothetical protein